MTRDDADHSAKQFQQSMPDQSTSQMGEARDGRAWPSSLDHQYKPVGISAVKAAAQFTKKKPTKNG